MALDITLIDNFNLPRDVLSIPLEIYGTIFSILKIYEEKYPLLMRMKDYYRDAYYLNYEIVLLLKESLYLKDFVLEEKPAY